SVVTHEVGHALGFEHRDVGVMAASLAPGSQSVGEARISLVTPSAALPMNTTVSIAAPTVVARAGFDAREILVIQPSGSSMIAQTGIVDVTPNFGARGVDLMLASPTRVLVLTAMMLDDPIARRIAVPAPISPTATPLVPGSRLNDLSIEAGSVA